MSLHDQYKSINKNKILEYIHNQQEENLNLEFKSVNNSNLSDSNDRRNLAKALSGFANSDGGLIIWGVVARVNAQGIDCASEDKPIDDVNLFLSKINEFTGTATSPIIDCIKHKKIFTVKPKGYVISYIPESINGPHMAKFRENRYYKRSGDSFYQMEHFDIADMFGKRKRPDLYLNYYIRQNGWSGNPQGKFYKYEITFGIMNKGRGSAHSVYFAIENRDRYTIRKSPNSNIIEQFSSYDPNWRIFTGQSDLLIHPGTFIDICNMRSQFNVERLNIEDLTINYKIAADNIELDEKDKLIKRSEVLEIYPEFKTRV